MAALKSLEDHSVIVAVVQEERNYMEMRPDVLGGLMGIYNDISSLRTVTFDSNYKSQWAHHDYADLKNGAAKEVLKASEKLVKGNLAAFKAEKPGDIKTAAKRFPAAWYSKETKYFLRGDFVSLKEGKLELKPTNGKSFKVNLGDLSDIAQAYAQELAGAVSGGPSEVETVRPAQPVARASEPWTNTEGKEISAAFVKLEGENVRLKLANGKEMPIAMSKLSEASQTRARELGAVPSP